MISYIKKILSSSFKCFLYGITFLTLALGNAIISTKLHFSGSWTEFGFGRTFTLLGAIFAILSFFFLTASFFLFVKNDRRYITIPIVKKTAFFLVTGAMSVLTAKFVAAMNYYFWAAHEAAVVEELVRQGFRVMGRPLKKRGKIKLSPITSSQNWLVQKKFSVPKHDWLGNAKGEHSSISAFAGLSLKLADMGAPPDLLKHAHRAAIDEINHAQLAFTLDAARNDNHSPQGPAPKLGLLGNIGHLLRVQNMAVETFTDGCLFEARSAQGLRKMVDEEQDEAIRQEIQRTVVEEDSHVELAWKILEWCFREMTQPVLRERLYGQLVKILDRAETQDGGEMGDILRNARVSLEKIYAAQAA